MATPTARIINVGKRKFIPALEVTRPNGTVDVSKGNRAVAAKYVSFNAHTSQPDAIGWSTHARRDLAETYSPNGSKYADQWIKVAIVEVEPHTG